MTQDAGENENASENASSWKLLTESGERRRAARATATLQLAMRRTSGVEQAG